MAGGKVPDKARPVYGNKTTLWAGERYLPGQQGRDLVFEVDGEVVGAVLGWDGGRADGAAIGAGKHLATDAQTRAHPPASR